MTLWDGGGNDTYDLSSVTVNVTIDLRPGEWTKTSHLQLANLGDGQTARGNVANALLYNDDLRSLIENAIGGSGNDVLVANQVANRLTGGANQDVFRFHAITDRLPGATADILTDFSGDIIDLSAIDADATRPGNAAFLFVGSAAFSNRAGELRFDVVNGGAHIFADVNGDGLADMQIIANNSFILQSMFVL